MTEPHYIPLATVEDETELVRRCLRKFGRQLQRQGEIPGDVSEAEINEELEQQVVHFLRTLHHSPLYPHLKEKGRKPMEECLMDMITSALSVPRSGAPDVAADQAYYVNQRTGQVLPPVWKHRNCGGNVYPTNNGDTFLCSLCRRSGQLGIYTPRKMSRTKQMEYLLTEALEVDLT